MFIIKAANVIKIYALKKTPFLHHYKGKTISETELILNKDGSIYHLSLKPEQLANDIIIVGDQDRVEMVSRYFDSIEFKVKHREFVTHTGYFNRKKISVISTGIGTDNIDIFLNEADALANIDFRTRKIKTTKRQLNIIRIGTSGALQMDISVNSFVVSKHGLGIDGLLHYYKGAAAIDEKKITSAFISHMKLNKRFSFPYCVQASDSLFKIIGNEMMEGITVTSPGFYAPQGRELRLKPAINSFEKHLSSFRYKDLRIVNFEMETSALYGLSKLLGHNACTVCLIVGNRISKRFSENYKPYMEKLIQLVLQRLTS